MVYEFLSKQKECPAVYKLAQSYPRKVFDHAVDGNKTLKELGLSPSASLIVQ